MSTLVEGSFEEVIKKEPTKEEPNKPKKQRKTKNVWKIISRIIPTGFDALAILFYGTIFTFFSNFLKERPVAAIYSFLGIIFLTVIGIYLIKIAEPKAKKRSWYATIDMLPSLGFAFFIVSSLARVDKELFSSVQLSFSEYDSASTWIAFAIFIFIALWIVYAAFIIMNEFEGKIKDGEAKHPLALAFSFFSINFLVIITTVLWETFYLVDVPSSGNILNLIFYILVFYFFVASPRLIGLINKFSWPQFVTAIISIGYYIWYLLPRIQ